MSESADESSSSRFFKLGLFVLVSVAILVAGVIVLGAGALFRRTVPAETLVYESVNGLDVGSAVKFRGVPIGKVTDILFASAKYAEAAADKSPATGPATGPTAARNSARAGKDIRGILIEMSLTERAFPNESEQQITQLAQQLIRRGLRARVAAAGISGQSYIECDILNPADNPEPPISWKPDVLYLPSAPGTLNQVLEAASQVAAALQKADLGKVVGHFDELVTQSTATVGSVRQVVAANQDNLRRTLAELPDTAARLRSTAGRADQLLADAKLRQTLDGLQGVGPSAKAALADVQQLAHEAQQLLASEGDDIRSILADLRRLAADGATLTDDAKANPSRLLFGQPPPRDAPPPPSRAGN